MEQPCWDPPDSWSLSKLNMEFPHDPAIPPSGMYPQELKMGTQTGQHTCVFIGAVFQIAKQGMRAKKGG